MEEPAVALSKLNTIIMRRKTFTLLFFLRKKKESVNHRIYLRITVDSERTEISIKRSIDPAQWDEARRCAKNSSPASKEINSRLDQIKTQIYQYERDLIGRNKPVTAQSLKDAYLKVNDEGYKMILQV
jgi:hypothetical protein